MGVHESPRRGGGVDGARPLRALILNQPFHPDVVATAQIAKDLADALVERGHSVTAIASRSIYGRTGAALPAFERVDGVEIHRVGSARFGRRSTLGRLLDFAAYYLQALLKGLRLERFDVVICLTTPPYIALVGLLIRAVRGGRVVYWLMDVYPDVMVAHGMLREGSIVHRILRWLHHRILESVDATIALGRCMRDRLVAQGVAPERVAVIPVWPVAEPHPAPNTPDGNAYRREWGVGGRTLVMYSGNFGLAHDVETFLEAAALLRDDDRIRFAFVGGGKRKAEVEEFVRERSLTNCTLADYQPRERLAELLAAADAHLVTMLPRWWGLVVPSKFFGVAGAGRPVLFIGPASSEIARLCEETGCGERVEPGDAPGLASRIRALAADPGRLRQMGRAGAAMAEREVSRRRCVGRVVSIVEGEARPASGEAGSPIASGSP